LAHDLYPAFRRGSSRFEEDHPRRMIPFERKVIPFENEVDSACSSVHRQSRPRPTLFIQALTALIAIMIPPAATVGFPRYLLESSNRSRR
jgi:hypothetical protein